MNKIIISLAILALTGCDSYAKGLELPDGTIIPMEFDEYGGPLPSPGIRILPYKELPHSASTPEKLAAEESERAHIKKIGYDECVKDCKNIRYHWQDIIQLGANAPIDVIKLHLSNMKLSFPYKGIPFIKESDVMVNIINSSNENDEVTILTQIFRAPDNLGQCGFEIADNKVFHTFLAVEDINYDVNGKVTENMHVYGNTDVGFVYTLPWYDDKYSYSLTCLDYKFNHKVKAKITTLAKRIDSTL